MLAGAITPYRTESPLLRAEAGLVLESATALGRSLHPRTLEAASDLLRTVNCYYSNLIEGHRTLPSDIERAIRGDYSADPAQRDLQLEGLAHIEVQRSIERVLTECPTLNPCAGDFVQAIHREFYERLPESMRVVRHPVTDRTELVVPGEYRTFDVTAGNHVAPSWADIPELMSIFAREYDLARFFPAGRDADRVGALLCSAAAHHRLLWIHPFGDGNGRVARLMTDAALRRAGAGGHGLWTISRGFARERAEYYGRLEDADNVRWNSLDGRGELSLAALDRFCDFFLRVCADQIRFMSGLLAPDGLLDRVAHYTTLREEGHLGPFSVPLSRTRRERGRPTGGFRAGTGLVLRALVLEGEVARSRVTAIARASAPTASRLARSLVDQGFAVFDEERGTLRVRFPAHALQYIFPALVAGGPVT